MVASVLANASKYRKRTRMIYDRETARRILELIEELRQRALTLAKPEEEHIRVRARYSLLTRPRCNHHGAYRDDEILMQPLGMVFNVFHHHSHQLFVGDASGWAMSPNARKVSEIPTTMPAHIPEVVSLVGSVRSIRNISCLSRSIAMLSQVAKREHSIRAAEIFLGVCDAEQADQCQHGKYDVQV